MIFDILIAIVTLIFLNYSINRLCKGVQLLCGHKYTAGPYQGDDYKLDLDSPSEWMRGIIRSKHLRFINLILIALLALLIYLKNYH